MKRILKWTASIVAVLLILIVAALFVIPRLVDVKHYRPMIEKRVAKMTGRSFTLGEDLRFSLFPWAGLSFTNLKMGNPPGFAESDFVTVKSFDARVKLLPLLVRNVQMEKFVLDEPRIVFIRNEDGRGNWEFHSGEPSKPSAGKPPEAAGGPALPLESLAVGEFAVRNGTVVWMDLERGLKKEITGINLVLENLSLDKPVGVRLSGRLDGRPVSLDGTVGPVGPEAGKGVVPMDLTLAALGEITVKIMGKVENPPAGPRFDLTVEGKDFSPRGILDALGRPLPVNPSDPRVLRRASLAARIQGDSTAVAMTNGKMVLDDTTMKFSVKAREFSQPDVVFDLHIDKIDLDRYLPPKTEVKPGASEGLKARPGTGNVPIDYGPLRRLVLEGQYKVDEYRIAGARIENLLVGIRGKGGIFNINPITMSLYGGTASGEKTINVQGKSPKAEVRLSLGGVQAGPLLNDVLKKDFLEGIATVDLKLSAAGDTAEKIKKSLNGTGEVKFSDGAVKGIDLASMARNVKAAFGMETPGGPRPRTDFTELAVPFTITDGLVNIPLAALKAPFIRLEASGKANLVDETLDFRVVPKAVATIQGQGDEGERKGILVPLLVSGTFEKPVFMPDLKSILTQEIDKGLLEKEPVKRLLENKELRQYEEPAKAILKELMKKP